MFKKGLVLALSLVMVTSLAGCANGIVTAKSDYEKCQSSYYGKVKLASYDEFEVYEDENEVTDDAIEEQLSSIKESLITYEATEETDVTDTSIVNISYVGTIKVNKEDYAFNGGTADKQTLDIANSNYIEGFAEGLVGHKVGETVNLKLKFPETYSGSTTDADGNSIALAGKNVKFEVTINSIDKKVEPELTDDYVKENLSEKYGVETVKDLKAYFENQLRISNVGQTTALDDYVGKCTVEVDEEAVDKEVESQLSSFEDTLEQNSMTMDDYLTQYGNGQTEDDLKKQVKESVTKQFETYGVICAIVEKSGEVLTKERYNELLSQLAAQSQYDDAESFVDAYEQYYNSYYGQEINAEDTFTIQFVYLDAMEILIKNTKVKEGTRPEETTTEQTTEVVEDETEADTTAKTEETTAK